MICRNGILPRSDKIDELKRGEERERKRERARKRRNRQICNTVMTKGAHGIGSSVKGCQQEAKLILRNTLSRWTTL